MTVSLTPELEELVQRMVGSGLYRDASEVVREALGVLEQRDKERADIQRGIDDLEQGRFEEFDSPEELADEIKRSGAKRIEERRISIK